MFPKGNNSRRELVEYVMVRTIISVPMGVQASAVSIVDASEIHGDPRRITSPARSADLVTNSQQHPSAVGTLVNPTHLSAEKVRKVLLVVDWHRWRTPTTLDGTWGGGDSEDGRADNKLDSSGMCL